MSATLTRRVRNPSPDSSLNEGAPTTGRDQLPPSDPREAQNAEDKEELLRKVIAWHKESRDHYQEWRQEALAAFDYVAGHQWDDDDMEILRQQGRPVVTFNRIGPFVDGVSGMEIGNRQTTQYYPRQIGKAGVNELLTGASQWARDECDAEDEESEAFRDAIICGVGVTQTRLDYSEEPEGMIAIERVDPLELYYDPSSRKPNFADARFVIRCKDIPIAVAEEMFPDYDITDIHARWAEDEPDAERSPHNARLAPYYRVDQAGEIDRQRQQARIVEVEWWDYVDAYRVIDPRTGRMVRMPAEQAAMWRTRSALLGIKPQMLKDKEKRYYKAIVGAVVLTIMRGPDKGGFTYKMMTARRDRNKAYWYGLVRAMIDPQMWANKFFSQSLHIVNTNAKGGLLAETDAFADPDEARDQWAEADSIVDLNPGGLAKIKEKTPPPFPQQINQMMTMALDAIPSTAGINMEMIAQQQQDQAASLEMQRKQQGMTVLAYLFNAKRRYQKEQGRLMLWLITTFISDGRLIRIGGPEDAQFVPLIHDPGVAEYDVVVDEAPSSPNMKERVWGMIINMFPMLRTLPLPPQALLELMKYAPFPASLIQNLTRIMQQADQQAKANPQQNAAMQLAASQAQLAGAKAQLASAQTQTEQARTAHMGAQARHLSTETQLMPNQAQAEMAEQAARAELARAQAVNQLQNAQLSPGQALHDIMQDHADRNLDLAQFNHDRMMDVAQQGHQMRMDHAQFGHQQNMDHANFGNALNQQNHQQGLDWAQHALNTQQAMQPPPTPGGGAGGTPTAGASAP